jgi:hypothetical protein
VFERKILAFSAIDQPTPSGSNLTGSPVVQHRSRSALAQGRDESKRNGSVVPDRIKYIPIVQATSNAGRRTGRLTPKPVIDTDLRRQISEENKKVEGMSKEERDQERRDIIEHFGVGISDLLQKAREAREHQPEDKLFTRSRGQYFRCKFELNHRSFLPPAPSPPSALSTSSTRPFSRADRKLRFAT